MRVLALIMAGGKGKRMGLAIEKPLLPFLGRPLIEWVVEAVRSSEKVSEFYVATSKNTLETEKKCLRDGWKVIRTDGKGYHDDLKQAILNARLLRPVLTISSDLPALTGKFLDRIISVYEKSKEDALTVLVPVKKREELKLSVSSIYDYEGVAYAVSGVNLIDGAKILEKELNECAVITEEIEAALNVNTLKDLDTAEKIVEKRERSNSPLNN
jgi:adenosylcobinamide-phosphate guanylyltransferase